MLGDVVDNPRFVETVSRCGFRFLAPVQMGYGQTDRRYKNMTSLNSLPAETLYRNLTLAIVAIGFRAVPGSYQPAKAQDAATGSSRCSVHPFTEPRLCCSTRL